jgi:hypothetical protein
MFREISGPHVLDHRVFINGLISNRSMKSSKKYSGLLIDNHAMKPIIRKKIGKKLLKLTKDKYNHTQKSLEKVKK